MKSENIVEKQMGLDKKGGKQKQPKADVPHIKIEDTDDQKFE